MRNVVKILGVPIDNITLEEAGEITKNLIKNSNKSCKMIFAPNTEFIMTAQKDKDFYEILNKSELSTPDSIGVTLGFKLQKKRLKQRIPGQAYFRKIFELSEKDGITIYILGGTEEVIEKAVQNLKKKYPKSHIIGYHHGYLQNEQMENDVIEEINKLKPNMLFVAMGAPKQEKWIYKNRNRLKVDAAARTAVEH